MRRGTTYGVLGGFPTGTPLKNDLSLNAIDVTTLASFDVNKHMFARAAQSFHARITTGPNGCWLWTGSLSGGGYAQISVRPGGGAQPRTIRGARLAFVLYRGPIPDGRQLDHVCHSRASDVGSCAGGPRCVHRRCVNPWHLEPVTTTENARRASAWIARANWQTRKTHCPAGHPYSGNNLIVYEYEAGPKRVCRRCRDIRNRRVRSAA